MSAGMDDRHDHIGAIHIGRRYMHFKGGLYEVVATARHSESLELMVIYRSLNARNHGEMWARPACMWNDEVEPGVKRFRMLKKQKGEK